MEGYLQMMQHTGLSPVEYKFTVAKYKEIQKKKATGKFEEGISLNKNLGKKIRLSFSGEIRCVDCGDLTKKSFNQGSCYKCFISLAENDLCILKPETCHFHLGTCREPDWGHTHCFKKHILYLANSSGVKVGITKENPYSKRWVDQGAIQAVPVLEVESRKDAGLLEIEFGKFITDKTSWQKLISTDAEKVDLLQKKKELLDTVELKKTGVQFKFLQKEDVTEIGYPIQEYPKKKVSLKPEPAKPIEAELIGIKGQYLLFPEGAINMRSYAGYQVGLEILG